MLIFIYIALVLLLLPYILGPIAVKFTSKLKTEWEMLPVKNFDLPKSLTTNLTDYNQKLDPLAFYPDRMFYEPGINKLESYVACWRSDKTNAFLYSIIIGTTEKGNENISSILQQTFQFLSVLTDRTDLVTTNSNSGKVFYTLPRQFVINLPKEKDLGLLHLYHSKA